MLHDYVSSLYYARPIYLDGFLYTLIAFVVVDYITGILRAGVEKKLSSRIGFKGIAKKIMLFILVGVGHLIDAYLITGANSLRSEEHTSELQSRGTIV